MKEKAEILVIGTNQKILATINRLLQNNELWNSTVVSDAADAVEECYRTHFDLLLIGAGLSDEDELKLAFKVKEVQPDISIVPHYGGGSGLLFAEIYLALGIKKNAQ